MKLGDEIVWENIVPGSTRFCRPLELQYHKETYDFIQLKYREYKKSIDDLQPFLYRSTRVRYKLLCTMIDGKVCNAITETKSTRNCNVCKIGPKGINSSIVPPIVHHFEFGLPILHSKVNIMNNILNISYRLPFRSQILTVAQKSELKVRENVVKEKLKMELGQLIGFVRQGVGSSSTGNRAKAFFHNFETVSNITGIDLEFLRDISQLLHMLSSHEHTNIDDFRRVAGNALDRYNHLYSWYAMSPTLHKVLVHGADIISFLKDDVPSFGMCSEEPMEGCHKLTKHFRTNCARLSKRQWNTFDIFHRLILESDPKISSKRNAFKTIKISLEKDYDGKLKYFKNINYMFILINYNII